MFSCSSGIEPNTEPEVFQDMTNFELTDARKYALSLRFQFPKFSKGHMASDFDEFVQTHVGEANLSFIGRLSFPNEWQMQVTSSEIREKIVRMGRIRINNRSCWVSPLSPNEVRGNFHWVPCTVPNDRLKTLLAKHGDVQFIENQFHEKWSKAKVQSDTRYFALYLKPGQTMDDIPHFIRINDSLALIAVKGRPPACFHCREVGHRKTECKKYREKVSDYSSRPAGESKRLKPRGQRHKPAATGAEGGEKKSETRSASKKKRKSKAKTKALPSEASGSAQPNVASVAKEKEAAVVKAPPAKTVPTKATASNTTLPAAELEKMAANAPTVASFQSGLEEMQKNLAKLFSEYTTNMTRQLETSLQTQSTSEAPPASAQAEVPAPTAQNQEKKKKKKKKKSNNSSGAVNGAL